MDKLASPLCYAVPYVLQFFLPFFVDLLGYESVEVSHSKQKMNCCSDGDEVYKVVVVYTVLP